MSVHPTTPAQPCSRTAPRTPQARRPPCRRWLGAVLLVGGDARAAWAVSTRDLIELSKAGLGDEVLVALIEADGTIFNLDAPKILELRAAGVSERVITAMLRNASRRVAGDRSPTGRGRGGRAAPPPAPAEQDGAPYFVVIGEKPPAPPPPPAPTYFLPWIPWAGTQADPRGRAAHDRVPRLRAVHQRRLGRQHPTTALVACPRHLVECLSGGASRRRRCSSLGYSRYARSSRLASSGAALRHPLRT